MHAVCYSQLGYNIRILNLQIVIDRLEAFLVKNIECFSQLRYFMYFLEQEIPRNTDIFLSKINQSMPVCYSQLVYNISQLNLHFVEKKILHKSIWCFTDFRYSI